MHSLIQWTSPYYITIHIKCDRYSVPEVSDTHFEISGAVEIGSKIGTIKMKQSDNYMFFLMVPSPFFVDSSGNVYVMEQIDTSEERYYSIPAKVNDSSVPPKSRTFTLSVTIKPLFYKRKLIAFDKDTLTINRNQANITKCKFLVSDVTISNIIVTSPTSLSSSLAITDDCTLKYG